MSAFGGGAGSQVGREVLQQLREAADALKDFRQLVNDAGGGTANFRAALADATEFGIRASTKAAVNFSKDAAFGVAQDFLTLRGNGNDFSLSGSVAGQIGRAGQMIPELGDLYAQEFGPVQRAQNRVAAVATALARSGAEPSAEQMNLAFNRTLSEERRAEKARIDVDAMVNHSGENEEALDRTGRRMWRAGGSAADTVGGWVYDMLRAVGLGSR